jgi:hypothetical protein
MPKLKISSRCLTDFLAEDLTQTQIAKACNITRQAVHARINYTKTPQRAKRIKRQFAVTFLHRIGFTIPEIQIETGYCEGNIRKLIKNNGGKTPDPKYTSRGTLVNDVKIRHFQTEFLYRIGFDIKTIAKFTGYKQFTVLQYLYEAGYSLKGRLR